MIHSPVLFRGIRDTTLEKTVINSRIQITSAGLVVLLETTAMVRKVQAPDEDRTEEFYRVKL